MIPLQQQFEEEYVVQQSNDDTHLTIKQIVQEFHQSNNQSEIQEHPKSADDQLNMSKYVLKDQQFQTEIKDFALGLKKYQSENLSDYKKSQVLQLPKHSCVNIETNMQKIELSSIIEQQSKQMQKQKNLETFSSVDIVPSKPLTNYSANDEWHKILFEINQNDIELDIKRQQLINLISEEGNQFQQNNENELCLICGTKDAKKVQLLECGHEFCLNCYKDYLEDKIKSAKINNILCLQDGCTVTFPESVIKDTVSQQKYSQYLLFKYKLEIENDMNKKWCPAVGCDLYVERDPNTNLVYCKCGSVICFKCGQLAHQGQLCQQAIEADFQNALNKYCIKYCPGCKAHVEKNAGCNHMTCCQCNYQYCWVCLQPYYDYHYRYWSIKGCAIWSNGRFKTNKVIKNPDKMRWIFFLPRLILFLLRGPLLLIKFLMISAGKSLSKPYLKLFKKVSRSIKPRKCCLKVLYFLFTQLLIVIIVILIFPFYFLFYQIFKEMKWLCIKGCAY